MAYTATLGTSGTTAAFASDVVVLPGVTTAHYPNIKMIWGADSTGTPVSDATPMPVQGSGGSVHVQLTVTTGTYTSGDVVGGLITFPNAVNAAGGSAILNSVKLTGVTAIGYELHFFNADLTTPLADNEAFNVVVGDTPNWLGMAYINAGSYVAAGSNFQVACERGVGLQMQAAAATTNLYAYMVTRNTTAPATARLDLTADFEHLS